MNKFLLDALSCPFCSGEFTVSSVQGKPDDGQYAVLSCYCEQYPVVAGIPIIRKGIIGNNGETTQTVSELIVSGRHQDALLAVTMPPAPALEELAPACDSICDADLDVCVSNCVSRQPRSRTVEISLRSQSDGRSD